MKSLLAKTSTHDARMVERVLNDDYPEANIGQIGAFLSDA